MSSRCLQRGQCWGRECSDPSHVLEQKVFLREKMLKTMMTKKDHAVECLPRWRGTRERVMLVA